MKFESLLKFRNLFLLSEENPEYFAEWMDLVATYSEKFLINEIFIRFNAVANDHILEEIILKKYFNNLLRALSKTGDNEKLNQACSKIFIGLPEEKLAQYEALASRFSRYCEIKKSEKRNFVSVMKKASDALHILFIRSKLDRNQSVNLNYQGLPKEEKVKSPLQQGAVKIVMPEDESAQSPKHILYPRKSNLSRLSIVEKESIGSECSTQKILTRSAEMLKKHEKLMLPKLSAAPDACQRARSFSADDISAVAESQSLLSPKPPSFKAKGVASPRKGSLRSRSISTDEVNVVVQAAAGSILPQLAKAARFLKTPAKVADSYPHDGKRVIVGGRVRRAWV